MNSFGVVFVFAIAALRLVSALDPKFDATWDKFKLNHGKDYTPEEEAERRSHFENHIQNVVEHNTKFDLGLESYQMSVNHEHADKPFDEFKKTMLGAMPPDFYDGRNRTDFSKFLSSRAVTAVDWTKVPGRVTSVKNQGSCGSCWTFATVGALEGQFGACGKQAQDLSMQYILDCASKPVSTAYGSYGCDGGWPASAMDFVKKNGGVPVLSDYPYKGKQTSCPGGKKLVMPVTGKTEVGPQGDENAVAKALETRGPMSIAIQVDDKMQNYRNGVFSSTTCNKDVNHAVLLVGTGTENGLDYWKIKNSWGTGWGEGGYIRIARNQNNMCLVADYASVPTPDCSKVK